MADNKETIVIESKLGKVRGIHTSRCDKFLGLRYATASRFRYAEIVTKYDGEYDATHYGPSCPQGRTYFEHLENPERLFYHSEFRKGIEFNYSEDCLNLNIYTPETKGKHPVIIYIHGGSFNSGANCEGAFDGTKLTENGVVTVFINYRVGVLGYLTHSDVYNEYKRDGNFGLDDIVTAIKWVKGNISSFGGDENNITLMGQSAGAMQIQYLVLDKKNEDLFQRAIMLSGAGLFPSFSLPRKAEDTHEYWAQFMKEAGVKSLEELRALDLKSLFSTLEEYTASRKGNIYSTMPVIDGVLIPESIDKAFSHPINISYMVSYTNADMYAPLLAHITNKFASEVGAYRYYFDINAPGDDNRAFHSCDLRYVFSTLLSSWRPYDDIDEKVSDTLSKYIASFALKGDPNTNGLPLWKKNGVLCISRKKIKMGHPSYLRMTLNFIHRQNPKAENK